MNKRMWVVQAQGIHDDGTDSFYHHLFYAQDAAEAWNIFAAQFERRINFYEISVTEVKRNE